MLRAYIAVTDNKVLIAYANNNNSFYGTTTILEVFGNQIAGSFLNNSKDAIALESGEGGDTIKFGFGGYCACEGITAGQTIDSEGVTAYSPLDGWLEIKDPWAKGYVTGEYTGDGNYGADKPTVIDVGFSPQLVIVMGHNNDSANAYRAIFLRDIPTYTAEVNNTATYGAVTFTDTGILFYCTSQSTTNNAQYQMNKANAAYRYIAWR